MTADEAASGLATRFAAQQELDRLRYARLRMARLRRNRLRAVALEPDLGEPEASSRRRHEPEPEAVDEVRRLESAAIAWEQWNEHMRRGEFLHERPAARWIGPYFHDWALRQTGGGNHLGWIGDDYGDPVTLLSPAAACRLMLAEWRALRHEDEFEFEFEFEFEAETETDDPLPRNRIMTTTPRLIEPRRLGSGRMLLIVRDDSHELATVSEFRGTLAIDTFGRAATLSRAHVTALLPWLTMFAERGNLDPEGGPEPEPTPEPEPEPLPEPDPEPEPEERGRP